MAATSRRLSVLAVIAVLALASCSGKKQLSADDLQSQFTKAVSLASEAELFLDFVRQGRATRTFVEEHVSFVQDEIKESVEELSKKQAAPADQPAVNELKQQLQDLSSAMESLPSAVGDDTSLAAISARLARTHKDMSRAKAGK